MGTYRCSDGTRISQSTLDYRIRKAKAKKLKHAIEKYGYIFCEKCKRNDCKPVDCSHIVSVQNCKDNGTTEKAYDVENLQLLGRKCHQQYDGSGLKFTSEINEN